MSTVTLQSRERAITVDLAQHVDVTIPIVFEGDHVGAYRLPDPRETPVRTGRFVGRVDQGGAVNCMELSIFPHGNGTHTEGPGHVTHALRPLAAHHVPSLAVGLIVSVLPQTLAETDESYGGKHDPDDDVVTRHALEAAVDRLDRGLADVLVVRTQPNPTTKRTRVYGGRNPPYLTTDAVSWLVERHVKHLVVDLPSIDREDDGGAVANHCRFFGIETRGPDETVGRPVATITELVYVPDHVHDGPVAVSIQVPRIETDAVPSRVLLYPPVS